MEHMTHFINRNQGELGSPREQLNNMSKKDGASYIHTEFLVPQHGTDQ